MAEAYQIQVPTGGGFITGNTPERPLYYQDPQGKLHYVDVTELLTPEEKYQAGSYGSQLRIAWDRLASYGLRLQDIGQINLADNIPRLTQQNYDIKQALALPKTYAGTAGQTAYIGETGNLGDPGVIANPVNPNQGGPSTYTQAPLTGAASTAATGAVAMPNNGTQQQDPLWLRSGETMQQYFSRVSQMSPGYAAAQPAQTSPTLSTSSMTAPSTNFKTADFSSMFQLSPIEQDAQNRINAILGMNSQLAGQSQYQADLEKEKGYGDVQNRFNSLVAEQQAIPLQMQEQFRGRGVTKQGTQPVQTAALNNNAIATLATATQLKNLREEVDREVQAKYGMIAEQVKVNKENLQLMMNSPEYSAAEKQRAAQQAAYFDSVEQAINQQKSQASQIEKIRIEAALAGADAQTLDRIGQQTDTAKAAQIAAPYLQQQSAPKIIGSADSGYYTIDGQGNATPLNLGGTGTNTPINSTFTSTQLNQGAANSAMTLEQFKQLPPTVQNFYVNSKELAGAFNEALASVASGAATKEQVITNIQNMSIPPEVKTYLSAQVNAMPSQEQSGGWWSGLWDRIVNGNPVSYVKQ